MKSFISKINVIKISWPMWELCYIQWAVQIFGTFLMRSKKWRVTCGEGSPKLKTTYGPSAHQEWLALKRKGFSIKASPQFSSSNSQNYPSYCRVFNPKVWNFTAMTWQWKRSPHSVRVTEMYINLWEAINCPCTSIALLLNVSPKSTAQSYAH